MFSAGLFERLTVFTSVCVCQCVYGVMCGSICIFNCIHFMVNIKTTADP